MSSEGFREQLNAAATRSHVLIPRLEKVAQLLQYDIAAGASCLSVFSGSTKGETLVITSLATHSLRIGLVGAKQLWSVDHDDLRTACTGRRTFNGYVVDSVVLTSTEGRERDFQFGFFDPRQPYDIEIAEQNATAAVEAIAEAASLRNANTTAGAPPGDPLSFDPDGPEKTGSLAREAYGRADFAAAFGLYVKAIDQLHDFYVYEQFRNRQPSPKDTWIVDGLTASLGAARQQNPDVDVRDEVREATHRLRTISSACENSGANPVLFRRALDQLGEYAPDIDVSDIYWT
jgi:hypothetical protein